MARASRTASASPSPPQARAPATARPRGEQRAAAARGGDQQQPPAAGPGTLPAAPGHADPAPKARAAWRRASSAASPRLITKAQFGPVRTFVLGGSHHPNHPVPARKLQDYRYLRWRNAHARHPDVLAAQRRERARVRASASNAGDDPDPGRVRRDQPGKPSGSAHQGPVFPGPPPSAIKPQIAHRLRARVDSQPGGIAIAGG